MVFSFTEQLAAGDAQGGNEAGCVGTLGAQLETGLSDLSHGFLPVIPYETPILAVRLWPVAETQACVPQLKLLF